MYWVKYPSFLGAMQCRMNEEESDQCETVTPVPLVWEITGFFPSSAAVRRSLRFAGGDDGLGSDGVLAQAARSGLCAADELRQRGPAAGPMASEGSVLVWPHGM